MAQRVTLLGEVINTTNTTFRYGPADNFFMRSHNTRNTPLHMAQRVTLL